MKSSMIIGRAYGPRTAATLQTLAASISYGKLVLDGGDWVIDDDVTLHAGIALEVYPDSVLQVSEFCTLTINCNSLIVHRPNNGWYDGLGTVTVSAAAGLIIGDATNALTADAVNPSAINDGLFLEDDGTLSLKQATTSELGGAQMASLTELRAMVSETLMVNPATLKSFISINYAYNPKTDAETVAATGAADARHGCATQFGVTITPRLANSKILLLGMVRGSSSTSGGPGMVYINRKIGVNTAIELQNGDTASLRAACYGVMNYGTLDQCPICLIDTPATIDPVTYYLTFSLGAAGNVLINKTNTDTDSDAYARTSSHLLAIEIPQQL